MRPITGPEICRLLEATGWRLERIKGSHHIYSKPGERRIITVPVYGNRDLKPGWQIGSGAMLDCLGRLLLSTSGKEEAQVSD